MCGRWQRGVPGPRMASAYEQETLGKRSPGRGARGISSEWKEKAPPHPKTTLAPALRWGGESPGVPLLGCPCWGAPGGPAGPVFPRQDAGRRLLRQLVCGRR